MKNLGFTLVGGAAGSIVGHFMIVPTWALMSALATGVVLWGISVWK